MSSIKIIILSWFHVFFFFFCRPVRRYRLRQKKCNVSRVLLEASQMLWTLSSVGRTRSARCLAERWRSLEPPPLMLSAEPVCRGKVCFCAALHAVRVSVRIPSFKFLLFKTWILSFRRFHFIAADQASVRSLCLKSEQNFHLHIISQSHFQHFSLLGSPPPPHLSWFPCQDGPHGRERSLQRSRTGQRHGGSQCRGENHWVCRFCAGTRLLCDGPARNPHLQHPEEERIQLQRGEGEKRWRGRLTWEGRWETGNRGILWNLTGNTQLGSLCLHCCIVSSRKIDLCESK